MLIETLVGTSTSKSAAGCSTATVISPMNSNFSVLISCRDVLRGVLERLHPKDLYAVASEREVKERAFKSPWKVGRILGDPSSPGFWRYPSLGRFAISHRLVRGDSVPVMDIKRLNNMMSDHGIHSRERLLIPVSDPALLHNSTCFIEMDAYAKREVAVLHPHGHQDGKPTHASNRLITERGKRKILESVKRSMQVDDGTAEYYLSIANGDPRAAILEFSEDLRWENQSGH
ncbi:unnamed protein product [Spirodela intermedia]|uniref:Uncharacterized protein n=1 Tax=Spirodela intermedia TaxID=51605 RepID=A0A7I8ING8_SPIIN|nr:unnamed protein product [Spirodela intermedia]CAA6659114.1 unnamed protein product [Spirodela intermedia]